MDATQNMMLIRHFLSEGRYEEAIALAAEHGMCLRQGRLRRNVLGEAIAIDAPLWVIERILTMCPEAAENVDANYLTPLHQAIKSGRPDQTELVKMLLPAFPGAAAIKNRKDLLPIFTSVIKYPDLETFNLLCDAHPACLYEMDEYGRTLLHHAVLRSLVISKAILERYPDAISETDGAGWMPIHTFCNNGKINMAREIFWLLYNAYPEAVHAPLNEAEDGTIVHMAVQNWLLPDDITYFLVKELPEAAGRLAGRGKDGLPFRCI
jgi:hypothetical protein